MKPLIHISTSLLTILTLLGFLSVSASSQNLLDLIPERSKEWKRLSTEQDSYTDVGVSSLVLEPHGILRATFRTRLSKLERAPEKPDVKYKTRLMTLQFDSRKDMYRIFETTLLDSSEKAVYESGQLTTGAWKPTSGGAFLTAASYLPPLGNWSVTSSSDNQRNDVTGVSLVLERFQIGRTTCSLPSYESTSISREELAKLTGLAASKIQPSVEKVNVIKMTCDSLTLTSEIHYLIPRGVNRAILLSGGTLFSLQQ
jgi:hypothetical protein